MPDPQQMPRSVAVVGIGQLLGGDDAVGVLAVEGLRDEGGLPPGVRLLEAGTLGVDLLAFLEPEEKVVLLDAVRAGSPPGTIHRLPLEEIGDPVGVPLSVHELGVRHLLQQARLLGRPLRGVLLGVEPDRLATGRSRLSRPVSGALPALLQAAREEARRLQEE